MMKQWRIITIVFLILFLGVGCTPKNNQQEDTDLTNVTTAKIFDPFSVKINDYVYFKTMELNQNNLTFDVLIKNSRKNMIDLNIQLLNITTGEKSVKIPDSNYFESNTEYKNWQFDNLRPLQEYCIIAIGNTNESQDLVFDQYCFKTEMFPAPFKIDVNSVMRKNGVEINFNNVDKHFPFEYIVGYKLQAFINDTDQSIFSESFNDLSSVFVINGLTPGTYYDVKLYATFNIDGVITERFIEGGKVMSLPNDVTISNIKIANPQAQTSDNIDLQIDINRTEEMTFTYVTVNGLRVRADVNMENTSILLYNFPKWDSYRIEKIEANYYGNDVSFNISENNHFELPKGEFTFYSVQMKNMSVFTNTDNRILTISMNNTTGSNVKSVNINNTIYEGDQITQTNNEILVNMGASNQTGNVVDLISSITLDNGAVYIYNEYINLSCVAPASQIKEIKTPQDLQNITSGYYILMNDLDMTGYNFTPIKSFNGCLSGNNYSISNLTIDTTNTNLNYASLFKDFTGVIENISFVNANVKSKGDASVVVNSMNGFIRNVNVEGNIQITSTDSIDIGGIAVSSHGYIYHSSSTINVSLNTSESYALGIGGLASSHNNYSESISSIDSSSSELNIVSNQALTLESNFNYIGGIVGNSNLSIMSRNTTDITIEMSVTAPEFYVGGIAGSLEKGLISKSTVDGSVDLESTSSITIHDYCGKRGNGYQEIDNQTALTK